MCSDLKDPGQKRGLRTKERRRQQLLVRCLICKVLSQRWQQRLLLHGANYGKGGKGMLKLGQEVHAKMVEKREQAYCSGCVKVTLSTNILGYAVFNLRGSALCIHRSVFAGLAVAVMGLLHSIPLFCIKKNFQTLNGAKMYSVTVTVTLSSSLNVNVIID